MGHLEFRDQRRSMFLPSAARTIPFYFPSTPRAVFLSRERLRKGENKKLAHLSGYLDMPSGVTCAKRCKGCYAEKAERLYPEVWNHRLGNYLLARYKPSFFFQSLCLDLNGLEAGSVVRIHSAGDFFSRTYVRSIFDVVGRFPLLRFFAFTKNTHALLRQGRPTNLNLIDSTNPFDGQNYTKDLDKLERAILDGHKLCHASLSSSTVTCGNGCTYCFVPGNNRVVFKEH